MIWARLICAGTLLVMGAMAHADPCKLEIESNDVMQYNLHDMVVPAGCRDVEVVLRHSGHLAAKVMGHDWVLAKESDMSAIVHAGMSAGFERGYLPSNDARIIAATKVVGGGESSTVTFSATALQPGVRYAFFCTSPGHYSTMHGRFRIEDSKVASAHPTSTGPVQGAE